MYKRGDKEFILDMFISGQKILEYIQGMTFDDFKKDSKTIDAVVRNIEILGEAVKNISREIKEKYPEIEWRMIARMRDKVIHFYFGVDISIVWKTANADIPHLLEKLKTVIKNEGWENELEV
ncbi:MAG: DUF86 domain-containing protein [Thermotogae bacterium]|nr:MAG: DUF86 domain-containing protein [Thermotogota bacterium]